jgi:hypothetical protein
MQCRICRLKFVPEVLGDRERHKKEHETYASGVLPLEVRDFLKDFGWAVAHDGGLDRLQGNHDREIGKLAVAYAWWARARENGIDEAEFDRYMAAHLDLIDARVEKDAGKIAQADREIEQWGMYEG